MKKIAIGELELLSICINGILNTSDDLGGGIIFKLHKNARIIKPHLEDYNKSRESIVLDLVDKDEDDSPKMTELSEEDIENKVAAQYVFSGDNEEKAQKEIINLLESEVEVELSPIKLSVFETLSFDTSKIPGFHIFMHHMIDEDN